jgi:hypothetical protein
VTIEPPLLADADPPMRGRKRSSFDILRFRVRTVERAVLVGDDDDIRGELRLLAAEAALLAAMEPLCPSSTSRRQADYLSKRHGAGST